jgi:hypothetical protein
MVREEHAVAGARVDIVVTVGSGHEGNVTRQIIVLIEPATIPAHASKEESFKGRFQGAFPCFQAVVVVELAAFQPKLTLSVIDDVSNDFTFVAPAAAAPRVA